MKKLFLLLIVFSFQSCYSQQPRFNAVEARKPHYATLQATCTQKTETTVTLVTDNMRIFQIDAKDDFVLGWEYVVRLQLQKDQAGKKVNNATLLGYTISPQQAAQNAAKISKIK